MEGEKLKGHLDMIVLAALSAAGSAHGYAVIEEIRRRSGGAFDLPEGTIYPALHRLEQVHVGLRSGAGRPKQGEQRDASESPAAHGITPELWGIRRQHTVTTF